MRSVPPSLTPSGDGFNGVGGGDGGENDFGASELLKFGCGVLISPLSI